MTDLRDEKITREDLSLLMESYKNMIESNLTLMEKQDRTVTKITNVCNILTGLVVKMKDNL